jgi:hypothetical protein
MNLRNLSFTVAGLTLLCVVAWYLQRPAKPASDDPRIGQPVLAASVAQSAAKVRVTDTGKSVTIARQADGTWQVPDYYDFPADFGKLSGLVGGLTGAKIQRLVTARADRLSRLEFKDATIALFDGAGKELWCVTLGKAAEGGGRFLRYGKEQKGYLADLSIPVDWEAKNWVDASLMTLKPDDVATLEIGFPAGPAIQASRTKKEGMWTVAGVPSGKRLNPDKITSLVTDLTSLRFTDTTPPTDEKAAAARAHSRTITLTTFDHKTYTILLGRKPEEKRLKPSAPEPPAANPAKTAADAKAGGKTTIPEYETIPAGPVFVFITCSDKAAPINGLMNKRAFEIGEWIFTGLPFAAGDLWENAPNPAEPKTAAVPQR